MPRIENPFIIISHRERQQEVHNFADKMCADKETLIRELEDQIAKFHYRRPIKVIDLTKGRVLCVRPFWRDRKPTPPLPWSPSHPYRYSHHF